MQRLLYSILSLLFFVTLLIFALPVFLVFAGFALILILVGVLTGRTSFRVYRSSSSQREGAPPQRPVDRGVIDITEDQEKK